MLNLKKEDGTMLTFVTEEDLLAYRDENFPSMDFRVHVTPPKDGLLYRKDFDKYSYVTLEKLEKT